MDELSPEPQWINIIARATVDELPLGPQWMNYRSGHGAHGGIVARATLDELSLKPQWTNETTKPTYSPIIIHSSTTSRMGNIDD